MAASRQEVLHAYRHLYKGLLRGVQYSTPARHIVRDQIRRAFRQPVLSSSSTAANKNNTTPDGERTGAGQLAWDAEAIKRTIWFLSAAAREKGLEHKILKNMVRVHGERAALTGHWRRASLWSKKP